MAILFPHDWPSTSNPGCTNVWQITVIGHMMNLTGGSKVKISPPSRPPSRRLPYIIVLCEYIYECIAKLMCTNLKIVGISTDFAPTPKMNYYNNKNRQPPLKMVLFDTRQAVTL